MQKISLVCSGKEDESGKLYGLGELSDEKLLELYENRTILSQDDIEFADYVWQLYCSDNPIRLENLIAHNDFQFEYLSDALKAHLKRFPTIKNGLNELENRILETALEQKPKSRKELLGSMLTDQGYYGFGDTQYDRIILSLKTVVHLFQPCKID